MKEHNLRDLITAYRETHSLELDSKRVEQRIQRSLCEPSERARRTPWVVGLAMASIFCASVAGATPAGGWLRSWLQIHVFSARSVPQHGLALPAASAPMRSTSRSTTAAPTTAQLRASSAAPEPSAVAHRPDDSESNGLVPNTRALNTRARVAHKEASAAPSTQVARKRVIGARMDRFEEAYNRQFRTRDYTRALGAWDQFLKTASTDALGVDARFYRAVCLVQLGRTHEAQQELQAFANGDYGMGRRERAFTLLRALQVPR